MENAYKIKTVHLFYNPRSGKKQTDLVDLIQEKLIDKGIAAQDISVIKPATPKECFALAKKASQEQVDLIIPLGGDGTLNKVIGGAYEGGNNSLIGLVPSGSVNNFAKALGIPLELEAAIDVIFNGHVKPIDICKANNHYMISSLTLGLLADIAANVTSEEKRKFGPLVFLKDSWRILRRNRTYTIGLKHDDSISVIKTKFLLITMTNTIAGFPSFSPDALVDDGYMQVYTMKKLHFWKFLCHIHEFKQGDFSQAEEIVHFKTKSLELNAVKPGRSANPRTRIDGDKCDLLPVSLEVIRQAISIIVPKENLT